MDACFTVFTHALSLPFPPQNLQKPISTPQSSKFSKNPYRNSAMELELGFKITKTRDTDHTSADFRITKDRAGPIFFSTETETMFILTAHLKGFRRQRIKIDINEDGTQISISGEKHVQEMVMMKWTMHNKPVEIKRFRKVFRIPDGVILDRIKARFNEEDTILSIFMPKSRKGIRGIGIEEVKEEEIELVTEQSTSVPEMEIVEGTDQEQKETTTQISDEDTEIEEIITPIEEIEDVVPAIEIQDSETENIEPLEMEPEEKDVEPPEIIPEDEDQCTEKVEMMEIEPEQAPIEEIRRNDDVISEEVTEKEEDLVAEIIETVAEQGNDSSTSTSESINQLPPEEEVIEEEQLKEVEEIDQVQQILEEEERIEEPDVGFVEEELTEIEEEVSRNAASDVDDEGKGRGMFRFPTPRFMVGSAFIGLLIALIIQLLKKNKNLQRKY